MNYNIEYTKTAEKFFHKIDKTTRLILLGWIKKNLLNCKNPRHYGKSLKGKLKGLWRYRVGNYRIIAQINDDKLLVIIIDIDHRKDIYK